MASSDVTATPKLRSRKHGAAVPLTERDRKLLNLMQGSFPLDERPYLRVAEQAGMTEDEVLADVQRLLDERIIRQVTPIFDTRALGYGSMLVAAKIDAENPWRAAKIVNSHPGVSHNYLRNHDFNMWFTLAVEERLAARPAGNARRAPGADRRGVDPPAADAQAVQDPHGPRDGGRHRGALLGGRRRGADRAREAALRRARHRRDPRDAGRPAGRRPSPGPAAARELGIGVDELLAHLGAMTERGLLRRVAAILFHRRAGFSANGMGVWQVPDDRIDEIGPRMAAFRGISHCYQRPTYADWKYQIFTMAHGRSKDECDAILDAIAAQFPEIEDRATLYSSTEFKKIRLLYFTGDFRDWEREHAGV